MTSTGEAKSRRRDRWLAQLRVTSTARAGVGGAVILAVVMTASIALGVTSDDAPVAAKPKPAAQTDESYLTPVGTLLQDPNLPRPSLAGDTGTAGVPTGTAPQPTTPVAQPPADAGRITTYSGGAGTLSAAGIATLAIGAGCSAGQAVTATAVAIAESGGSPAAQGDVTLMDATWDWSAGLWQIRGLRDQRGSGELRDSIANHDPATNAGAMYAISSGCTNWSPWTTFTRGTYQSFTGIAEQAVAYVTRYQRTHGGTLPAVEARDSDAPVPAGGGGANAAPATTGAPASSAGRSSPRASSARTSAPGRPTSAGNAGTAATPTPTPSKTRSATKVPTLLPTRLPTTLPTLLPTKLPTLLPTKLPTLGIGLP